jgi:ABC-type nitrate/sulfonate/bicarbonate transport system substrate-binding protein
VNRKTVSLILGLVAVLLVAFFVFRAGKQAPQSPTPAAQVPLPTIVWGGPKNIAMLPLIAEKKGFFKAAGLNTRSNYLQTGKLAMDAVISKDLDIGVLVDTNIAFVKFQQGADIRVVANVMKKYDDAIIARRDLGVSKPKDLEGRKLGILTGTTSDRFADLFIDHYKLDRKRIELVNLAPPAIQAAVLNGDLPAGSVWQPFRYNLQQSLGDKVVQFNNDKIYTAYALLTVRREFAERNPEAIQAFLKALLQAERFVRENRSEAISILAGELNIDPKVLDAIWGEYDLGVGFDPALKSVFVEEGEWVRRSQKGFADKPIPSYDDVLDPSFLRAVDGSRVTTAGSSGH